jgi:hypothetical protein
MPCASQNSSIECAFLPIMFGCSLFMGNSISG